MTSIAARVCILLALSGAGTVLAQSVTLPDPTPEIRRQELRQEQMRREQEIKPSVQLSAQEPFVAQRLPNEETCSLINEVVFLGLPTLDTQLANSLAGDGLKDSPIGRCLGVQGIAVLADRARNALIANGYITSRIEAATQDLSTGRLLLKVIVGRIALIDKGDGAAWIRHTAPLVSDEALNLRDIEQSLENLRRNPNIQAEFQLRAGARVDSSDVVLDYTRQHPLRGTLTLDDSGSSATGKHMAQGTLSWDSPLGLSDLAYGQFLVRADEIAGMSATQIQQYLALPKTPTQISEVIVPSGIRMQVGKVAPQPGFAANSAGGIQYQLLDTIPSSSFKTPKPL